jgi:hypothetical protein
VRRCFTAKCKTIEWACFVLDEVRSVMLLGVNITVDSCGMSVSAAGIRSLVVLRAAELSVLRCDGSANAFVGQHLYPCEIARGRGRYTCTATLVYRSPRCLACTRPVETYPRDKR